MTAPRPPPSPRATTTPASGSQSATALEAPYKRNHTAFTRLGLARFPWHAVLQLHPCLERRDRLLGRRHFKSYHVSLLVCRRTFRLRPHLGSCEQCCREPGGPPPRTAVPALSLRGPSTPFPTAAVATPGPARGAPEGTSFPLPGNAPLFSLSLLFDDSHLRRCEATPRSVLIWISLLIADAEAIYQMPSDVALFLGGSAGMCLSLVGSFSSARASSASSSRSRPKRHTPRDCPARPRPSHSGVPTCAHVINLVFFAC